MAGGAPDLAPDTNSPPECRPWGRTERLSLSSYFGALLLHDLLGQALGHSDICQGVLLERLTLLKVPVCSVEDL